MAKENYILASPEAGVDWRGSYGMQRWIIF
jgi:hypothetical protein